MILDRGLREAIAIRRGHRSGHRAERPIVAALLGRLRGELNDLRAYALGDDLRSRTSRGDRDPPRTPIRASCGTADSSRSPRPAAWRAERSEGVRARR